MKPVYSRFMSGLVSRIKELMEDKSLTSKNLAAAIGVQASTFSHYFSGRNSPSAKVVNKILATYPEINSDWLLRGIGPKYNTSTMPDNAATSTAAPSNSGHEPSSEYNLFAQKPVEQPVNPEKTAANTFVNSLFGQQNSPDTVSISVKHGEEPHTIIREVVKQVPSKIITRIVVYYSDNTYEDFQAK